MLLAASRGLRILLEQPFGSLAEEHPRMRMLFRDMLRMFSTTIWHGLYGAPSPKRQKLYSNDHRLLLNLFDRAGQVEPGKFAELRGQELVSRKRRADGTMAWTGNSELKSSQCLVRLDPSLIILFTCG